jgi:molecular chaperone HscB
MTFELADNDFVLFGIAPRFAQDRAAIDRQWKTLQTQVHPDRFAAEGAAAQRIAMQWATRVNEAYQRLKDPLARAAYLCELNGHGVNTSPQPPMPVAFLMQQMELREALQASHSAQCIEALGDKVAVHRLALQDQLGVQIDDRADWPAAAALVRALMFVTRLAQDIDQRLDTVG